MFTDASVHSAH